MIKKPNYQRLAEEDSEDAMDSVSQKKVSPEITQQIRQVTNSFQDIDKSLKQIEQLFVSFKKPQQTPQEITQTQKKVGDAIEILRIKLIPTASTAVSTFQKQIVSSQAPMEMKQELQKTFQQYQTHLNQKQQQVQSLGMKYKDISNKIDDQLNAAHTDEYEIKNFKLRQIEEDIDAELDDIKKINQQVNDVNQMMHIMSDEVDKCGETINIIEEHVDHADQKVVNAVENLKTARKTQKSKNKWLWIGLASVAVLAVVLLLIFVL